MAHRYRIHPDARQALVLAMHCAQARFVWNLALDQRLACYALDARPPRLQQLKRDLTEARGCTWLGDGSSSVQQQALLDFDQALRNWWGGTHRHPTWRKKGVNEGFCIRDVTVRRLNRQWATVYVPKLGPVKFRLSRPLPAKYGMGRVTLDRRGRWHISFNAPQPAVERESTGAAVGIDRGIANTITTSDGEFLNIPVPTKVERQRRARLQRKMARQQKGSNRRARTKLRLAVLTGKWADRRKDWVEKTSTWLVRNYDVIAFEDLKVKNMMRSAKGTADEPGTNVAQKRGLNRAIADAGWSMLERRTRDKAEASEGCVVVKVPAPGTSITGNECGHRDKRNRASQSEFRCVICGATAHADVNAAKNILAAGLAVTGRGGAGAGRASEASTERKERRHAA